MKRYLVLAAVLALVVPGGARGEEIGATDVFTRIGDPGMPEGIAVRDGRVYVGTHVSVRGNGGAGPSKIFVFDQATAAPIPSETVAIEGQNHAATHGILGMAFDAAGRLYVLDRNPPRMIRIDLASGEQDTYATIPDLPACRPTGPDVECAPVTVDEPAFPDYFAFGPDGSAYVTDLQAATIFRVPPGGGAAEIWFQDARLDGIFGPNGIAIAPGGEHLVFAMTGSQQPATPAQGVIYRLPLMDEPTTADLEQLFVYLEPATGPDGIAFGASGRLYVALAGSNQVSILQPGRTWNEVARFPETPVRNAMQEIPYDLPASIGFDGAGSLLVTNQSFFAGNPDTWAVLRAFVDDTAAPPVEPVLN